MAVTSKAQGLFMLHTSCHNVRMNTCKMAYFHVPHGCFFMDEPLRDSAQVASHEHTHLGRVRPT